MNSTYRSILLKRALGFWLVLRALFWGAGSFVALTLPPVLVSAGNGDSEPARFTYVLTVLFSSALATVTTGLVLFDARVAGEDVLLANLGVSRMRMAVPVVLLTGTLESALFTIWLLIS